MKVKFAIAAAAAVVLGAALYQAVPPMAQAADARPQNSHHKDTKGVPAVLNFKMKNLAGQEVDLAKYRGKAILMVNTASKCGYTPQYKELEELHEKYADKGLVILGFPSNDFGGQEPGTDPEIATFCKVNYGVKFDMFSKVDVKGPQKCALYQYLTSAETNPANPGEVKWNFEKFLIGRDGHIAGRFLSGVKPMSSELTTSIETELAKK